VVQALAAVSSRDRSASRMPYSNASASAAHDASLTVEVASIDWR